MRMWGVDPKQMCRQHLLGEHVELHMQAGTILADRSLEGFYATGLIDSRLTVVRHAALVKEVEARDYQHHSPLPDIA